MWGAGLGEWRVGRRVERRTDGRLGLLERWYAVQPLTRVAAVVVELDEPIDVDVLARALEVVRGVYRRSLDVTLDARSEDFRWRPLRDRRLPLGIESDAALSVWRLAERAVHQPFVDGEPLWRVDVCADRRALVASFHHAIADGMSTVIFARDLLRALAGTAVSCGDDDRPLEARVDLRPTLAQLWRAAREGNAGRAATYYAGRCEEQAHLQTRLHTRGIDNVCTAALRQRAREQHTSVHAALSAVAVYSAAQHADQWPCAVRMMSPVSLRPQCDPQPQGLGVYLCGVSTDHRVERDVSLWSWARDYRAQLRAGVQAAQQRVGLSAFAPSLRRVADKAQAMKPNARTDTVEVSNLGRVAGISGGGRVWFCQGNHYHGPLFNLSVVTSEESGDMRICLAVPAPLVTDAEAERYLDRIEQHLTQLALC